MPPPRLEAPEPAACARRLAVYTDYAYTMHEGQPHAERAFAMFMAAVLEHADESTIIGRLRPTGGQARYPLPAAAKFVALPYYPDGSRLLAVARALLRSATRLWHSLDGVDTVWILGPQGLALPFALVVMLRRRRLRLGVRQDLPGYARARHPGRRTVHLLADGLELGYRLLARRYPIVVVGDHLRRSYCRRSSRADRVGVPGAGGRHRVRSGPRPRLGARHRRACRTPAGVAQRRAARDREEPAAARGHPRRADRPRPPLAPDRLR